MNFMNFSSKALQIFGVILGGAKASDGRDMGLVGLGDLLSGEDQANNVIRIESQNPYYRAPPNATTILGGTGKDGDYLHTVTWRIVGAASLTIKDGADTLFTVTGIASNNPVQAGTFIVDAVAKTNWTITTQSGVEALCSGRFT